MSALEQLVDEIADKVAERILPRVLQALGALGDDKVETIQQFATRYQWSERHVGSLIKRGLPVVGDGSARRVRSHAADAWLIGAGVKPRAANDDDAITALAIRHARRGSR
jgi:hypothetical protein